MLSTRRGLLWRNTPEVWPGLKVRPRSEWTDADPSPALKAEEARFLLVHHTAGNSQHREADVTGILQGIRSFHVGEKGWPDIAYNFLIDRYGNVWEGRAGSLDGPVQADATGGNQGFSQLVCLIGDFTAEPPTEAAQQSLVRTLAWLAARYQIDADPSSVVEFTSRGSNRWPEGTVVKTPPIAGHRDMSLTSCPGDALYPLLGERISPMVHELLAFSPSDTTEAPVTTSTTSTTATTARTTTATTAPTTTTAIPAATIAPPSPITPLAATETREPGLAGLRLPILSVAAGALVALIGWRARRMSQGK